MVSLEIFLVQRLMIWITISFCYSKKLSHIIVHAGTNGAYHSTSREVLNKLLNFKLLIQEKFPDCNVFISTSTQCSDKGKATLTVYQLTNHLLRLNIDIGDNRNIINKHFSRRGLHLNESGSRRLAINFVERIKKFLKKWNIRKYCWRGRACYL